MGIKNLLRRSVKLAVRSLPYSFIVKYYMRIRSTKLVDIWEEVYLQRFFEESPLAKDLDGFLAKAESFDKYCIIKEAPFDYKLITFNFIREMMSDIIWSLERGYKPVIDILPVAGKYIEQSNLWEKMFKQPLGSSVEEALANPDKYIICPLKMHHIHSHMQDAYEPKKVAVWNKLFSRFLVFNDECRQYIEEEYKTVLKGKRCLACLIRGTDYTKTRPSGHPIQPNIEELLDEAEKTMVRENLDYVYLATEEKKYADAFKERFGNRVLENKRNYFDEIFNSQNLSRISRVNFERDDDDFLKSLEYVSSIHLLSKCDSMVAGLCGGSEAAVYMNGNNYNSLFLFDKGLY